MIPLKNIPLFLLVVILAVVLRLPLLNGSFWLDEAAQALESARPLAQQANIAPDFQPPFIHYVLHFALYVSESEWWLRTIAALIPSIVTIYVTYKVAQKWQLPQAGLIASMLLATSSLFIFYSQELRPYALPTMWAVLSWYCLLKAVNGHRTFSPAWLGYTLSVAAGLYSSFLFPFLVLSHITWILWSKREFLKPFVVWVVVGGGLFIPWLPMLQEQLRVGAELRQALPGWSEVVSVTQFKVFPLVVGKFIYGVLDLGVSPFFIVTGLLLGLVAVGVIWEAWQRRVDWSLSPEIRLLVCWLVVPIVSAWILSFWIPVIQPKRVLFLLPALYLLVGWLVVKLRNTTLATVLLSSLLLINFYSTASYYFDVRLQRENWRSLQQEISTKYDPAETLLIFAFPEPFASWVWYDQNTFTTQALGYLVNQSPEAVSEQLKLATEKRYLILFDYLTDLSDPQRQMLKTVESYGYQPIEIIDYPLIGFVRVYARPGMTVSLQSGTIEL